MKKVLFMAIAIVVAMFSLTSCQSKEEKIISRYEELIKNIEADEDFNEEDMRNYSDEFNAIKADSEECQFSEEQNKQINELNSRFVQIMASKLPGIMINNLDGIIKNGKDFIKGFTDGFKKSK